MALIDSNAGRRADIPHEPGQWLDIRPLNWVDLERAKKVKQSETFRDIGALGSDLVKQMQGMTSDSVAETLADPLALLDLHTVLCCGITGWSYGAEVTAETIKQLDAVTAKWAAMEIVQPQSEEQRKNS